MPASRARCRLPAGRAGRRSTTAAIPGFRFRSATCSAGGAAQSGISAALGSVRCRRSPRRSRSREGPVPRRARSPADVPSTMTAVRGVDAMPEGASMRRAHHFVPAMDRLRRWLLVVGLCAAPLAWALDAPVVAAASDLKFAVDEIAAEFQQADRASRSGSHTAPRATSSARSRRTLRSRSSCLPTRTSSSGSPSRA